ncbi:Mitochondrial intermediate peptidase [Geranomyces variabilis]|uniref:mitochondrial intermediate peptidase n=1 Tax=Geranomyces variabilis TaxID=109894 RepID=A0AAD5TIS4_9FUNG|nr:Mitochondrial intermediate peptidase [Geranomyces variabilis]
MRPATRAISRKGPRAACQCSRSSYPLAVLAHACGVPLRRSWSRFNSTTTTPAAPKRTPLQQIFDSPAYWRANRLSANGVSTGLCGLPVLDRPDGFIRAANAVIEEVRKIISKVCQAVGQDNVGEMRKTVKRLDRLSDILCLVVDSAELVRNVHPDARFAKAANDAHAALSSVINQLNTHQELYQALKRVMANETITKSFTAEEQRVGDLLLADFEKSGIHMPLAQRDRLVDLHDRIGELGHMMITNSGPGTRIVEIEGVPESLNGVPNTIVANLKAREGGSVFLSTSSSAAGIVLKTARDENVRKQVFLGINSGSKEQVEVVEALLWTRGELARLLGKESYAEMWLADKMAETPENVISFLESLSDHHKPRAVAELERLQKIKAMHVAKGQPTAIQAWDRFYYSQFVAATSAAALSPLEAPDRGLADPFHAARPVSPTSNVNQVSAYFSVGSTFQGLSQLFKSLYGITLEPAAVAPGEVWHDDVRRLDVVHETDGKIGIIYCDVFSRDSCESRKYESAAHFTVRCSRRVDDEEKFGQAFTAGQMSIEGSEKILNSKDGQQKRYQLPVVVLVTPFKGPADEQTPGLLGLWEIETLFHEMGHAMHSMLAMTDFQHIGGTRVPGDFVEVPSIFMENFARSPQILASFSQHYRTGEPIPLNLLRTAHTVSATANAFDTQHQLQLALLDQMYHSPLAMQPGFDSTAVLAESQRLYNVFPPVPDAAWQVQFTHLFSYGATYYSYLWSRRWASRIWSKWFMDKDAGAWKEGGELMRTELLGWGGGRDPWVGLERLGVVKEGERQGRFTEHDQA